MNRALSDHPGLKPAPAIGLLVAGACLGAALLALVSTERRLRGAAAGRDTAGSGTGAAGADATSPAGADGPPSAPSPPAGAPLSRAPQDGYAAVARAAMPAVVNISSFKVIRTYEYSPFMLDPFFRDFFGEEFPGLVVPRDQRAMSLGSGVVVDDQGTVLTNYHVVEQAQEVKAALSDGREVRARLLGADRRTDLAVLRVDQDSLPHALMGDSESLQVGDIVLAIGNPFGLGETVTMGIVSAIGRGSLGLADYEDFIQTDAAINPGNSGGALVNTRGEVVGINTAIYSRSGGYQGIGFAIPSNMARDVLQSILEHGRVVRGYAGIAVQNLTPEIARAFDLGETRGAVVASLDPDGPAAAAGLRRGDVIVSFRGRPVTSDNDVRTQLSRLKPGDRAAMEIVRDGRRREVAVVLAEPPSARRVPARRR
ncbi:MAG: Do family serine endopeptidase [Acidobacteria bacterium]|nr:Do family serine endopeptidase [Acidobacteriota bacterium]